MKIESLDEMNALGAKLATKLKAGDVLLLEGDLGVGKTALARAIVRSILRDQGAEIPSPSFTLVQEYPTNSTLRHFDLYRLGSSEELIELGLPDLLSEGISLVEWPERLGYMRPQDAITVSIADLGGEMRDVKITRAGQIWQI